ncbi:dihydroxyacetone kinase subunit DhaL [Ornithinimicrobium pratense]|uniref:Dihydroxyacetone kinase subunit L n=1 Tax=Ornithinimicrobium pratense TaxID=2593973 RepID=A0A5J6V6F1_9MICO|nr:dihydroxyacetone kinase subunit DhaL [Ornithinimicrobium pratense]QFG68884.1 dihydroxyacetone kinase subunit L [Ornithinimicrobium pratense]
MADLTAFQAWVAQSARSIGEHAAHLTDLDRAIGDGDHGANMERGFTASARLAEDEQFSGIDTYLKKVGMTLVSTVGGASGPLYGTFFLRLAGPLSASDDAGARELSQALRAGVEGIVARGKAERGDKTMYDAFAPALAAFEEAAHTGRTIQECLDQAARAAEEGRDATEPMVARKGRASYLGERSAGHVDPGASSAALVLRAAAQTLA